MKREKKSLFNKVTSLVLAVAMMFSMVVIMPKDVSAAEYTIKGSGTSSISITDEACFEFTNDYVYIKFIPAATGYVTVKATNISSIYNDTYGGISLCNASKQIISQVNEMYRLDLSDSIYYTMTYGVKKGTAYYLRVAAYGGTQITTTFKKVAKNAATKRTKAKTIASGKTVKGVIIAGDKKADWYKIKLTKSKKVKLSYTAKTNGTSSGSGIKVTFCKSNGKNFLSNSYSTVSRVNPSDSIQYLRRYSLSGKTTGLAAGTYYVKVEPNMTTSSGYYTLKWK